MLFGKVDQHGNSKWEINENDFKCIHKNEIFDTSNQPVINNWTQ